MVSCLLDLETSGFEADYNIILCAVIKDMTKNCKGEVTILRADSYPTWDTVRSNDAPICRALYDLMLNYDVIVAHNGVNFDVRFMMTRFLKWGIVWPQPKIVDPVKLARRYMRLGSNSLKSVCHHFGIVGKTECQADEWMEAKFDRGKTNKKAMNYVVDHCIADVEILEKVAMRLKHLCPRVNMFGSDT